MRPDSPPSSAASDGRIALDAALLKNLRKARRLSQEALADLCLQRQLPVSIASIKRAETGKVVLYRTARHLAAIFGVDADSLLAARATVSPAPDSAPAQAQAIRYLIELHVMLARAPGPTLQQEIDALVRSFGGRLDPAGGAHLLALFGQDQAYSGDAARCLRCALALRDIVAGLGAHGMLMRLARHHAGEAAQPPLPVLPRAGADDADMPIHVARDLASQLASAWEFHGAPVVPGFLPFARAAAAAAPLALAGRLSEQRQFAALAEAALEQRSGHIVYVRAMAGVGKSRLAAALADVGRTHGYACHQCEVADTGAHDWRAPLGQLARSLIGCASGCASGTLEHSIDAALAALGLPPAMQIYLRALTGARMDSAQLSQYAAMSHAARAAGMAEALLALITGTARQAPLLLLVEDVHWGAAHLFEALGALMAGTRDAPVIWLLTSRIEHDPLEPALRAHLFDLALTVFDLAPLAPREAQALAEQFPAVDPAYRARCIERAQGNALFLTQLLASPERHLPDSLKHLIQARLEALAPLQQRALRTAAVIGNRFELALLREALQESDYAPDAAGRNALIRRAGPDSYVFVHDLVMHCIYESIEPAQRRRMHRQVAVLYHERDAALAAQHMYHADDPAAFDMMLRAIRDKLAEHQYETALELADQCSANDSTRFSSFALALLKAHAVAGMGLMAQARLAYQHALMLAGRPQEKLDAVIGLAGALNVLDQLDEEERLLDDSLPLARTSEADAALARLLYLKGNIYFPRGNYSECRRHHEEAIRHARACGATETEARALSGVGDSYYAQGCMQQAGAMFAECLAMCERHGYVGIAASNQSALGSTRIYLGQSGQALDDALHSAHLARTVGNQRAEIVARMTAGWVLAAGGANDQAEAEAGAALALASALGATRFQPFLMETQARAAWQRGERALALERITAAAALVTRLRLQRFIGPWVLGTLALFTDDAALRKKALLQGAAWLTGDCLAHNGLRFFVTAAEVALLDGDLVAAEFYIEQLSGCERSAWREHHVALLRAHAAGERAQVLRLRGQGIPLGFALTTPRLAEV